MLNTRKGIFKLCMAASIGFIISALPIMFLEPTNEVARLAPVLFGLFMFVLGLTLDNKFEIDELRKQLANVSQKESTT